MTSMRRRFGLGDNWGTYQPVGSSEVERLRGALEHLLAEDPDTGELLDLGAVEAHCRTLVVTMQANSSEYEDLTPGLEAGLLVLSLRATSTGTFTVKLEELDGDVTRPWQDRAIPSSLIFGNGKTPLYLWTPEGRGPGAVLLPPGSNLRVTCGDSSGGGNTARITFEGVRIPTQSGDLRRLARLASRTPFVHVKALTIPAGVGSRMEPPERIKTFDEAPFVCHYINATVDTLYDLNFKGANSAREWFNEPVPVECLIGNGQFPGGLTLPRGLTPAEDILVYATNRQAGGQTPTLALIGAKRWR